MPSTSPGSQAFAAGLRPFDQILPGTPSLSLQSLCTFVYRHKRYSAYISGVQLNILSGPNVLVQAKIFGNDLVAIAAEDQTGKLLVASQEDVWVLHAQYEGWTKVWWEKVLRLKREDAGDKTQWLCWGSDGEALVGGSRALSLFSTLPSSPTSSPLEYARDQEQVEIRQALWSREISSPILFAEFSPSSSMIASCSHYDRLLKIWRRLSFEEALFDYTYLRHPGTITYVQWRRHSQPLEERRSSGLSSRHDEDAEILFTVADDAVLRVWRSANTHDIDIMTQYATIDLVSSIPQSPSLSLKGMDNPVKPPRYLFIVPSDDFCAAVRDAVGYAHSDAVDHSVEHLNEMASKEPDVIVTFDGRSRMSAWGLQCVGHKRRPETPSSPEIFHITHSEALPFRLGADCAVAFRPWIQEGKLHFLAHVLNHEGHVEWWAGNVKSFFSLSVPGPERLSHICTWNGHDSPILDLHSTEHCLTSRTSKDAKFWRPDAASPTMSVSRLETRSETLAMLGLQQGVNLVISGSRISLQDIHFKELGNYCISSDSQFTAQISYDGVDGAFGIVQTKSGELLQWKTTAQSSETKQDTERLAVETFSVAEPTQDALFFALTSTPALDTYSFIVCTNGGCIRKTNFTESSNSDLTQSAVFDTGIHKPAHFTATHEFAAIVSENCKDLLIIDMQCGYIEHRETFDQPIKLIESTIRRSNEKILAVSLATSVHVLIQNQYTYHTRSDAQWMLIKVASIQDTGLNITALTWRSNGTLTAAAGNGMLCLDSDISIDQLDPETRELLHDNNYGTAKVELQHLADQLHKILPAWHPNILSQLVQHGKAACATYILRILAQNLKFWSPGDYLDPLLDQSNELYLDRASHAFELSNETVQDLGDQLEEKALPQLRHSDQRRLKRVIQTLKFLGDHFKGLDNDALIYLYAWKLALLDEEDKRASIANDDQLRKSPGTPPFVPNMGWREIAFARNSATQQPLFDLLVLHYDNKITWHIARNLGIVAWLSDRDALAHVFEQLAQTAYRSTEPADPVEASLYFLALHKKPTLLALWRIATWHKEQRTTMNFLKRDFTQTDARTAAKKNAYALMGKRRFEYCAAFFLLADDPGSATSVLAGQCEDLALAIAVARLYSGDGSDVLRKLLEDRVVPQAKEDGDRWLLSWCHTVLLENESAAQSLIIPLHGIGSWQQDESSAMMLYQQLRKSSSEYEYGAILRSARVLRRMGLWLLALDLVSQWKFKTPQPEGQPTNKALAYRLANGVREHARSPSSNTVLPDSRANAVPSLLDDFTAPETTPASAQDEKSAREAKAAELLRKLKAKKEGQLPEASQAKTPAPTPTQFKEPDANSLLDSFGF